MARNSGRQQQSGGDREQGGAQEGVEDFEDIEQVLGQVGNEFPNMSYEDLVECGRIINEVERRLIDELASRNEEEDEQEPEEEEEEPARSVRSSGRGGGGNGGGRGGRAGGRSGRGGGGGSGRGGDEQEMQNTTRPGPDRRYRINRDRPTGQGRVTDEELDLRIPANKKRYNTDDEYRQKVDEHRERTRERNRR